MILLTSESMSKGRENTQLHTKFGFYDPDRKNHKHNYASQYIKDNVDTIAKRICDVEEFFIEKNYDCDCGSWHEGQILDRSIISAHASYWKPEYVLSKGTGQYQTTIGFIDLLLNAKLIIGYKQILWKVDVC
jgi:hypothetical protein